MVSAPRIEQQPARSWLLALSISLSALLHLGAWVLASVVFRPPALDIEFELPMDVELGTSEALEVAPSPSPVAEPPASGAAGARTLGEGLDGGVSEAGIADAASSDASLVDAGARRKPARDAGAIVSATFDGGVGPARLPPGTQIAVRVDMERIRQSPIAGDVRGLLAAIPDWRALLEGSGIDPVEQLDRLLIATPNLQREKVVLAGRYRGGEQVVLDAVAQLASANGGNAVWSEQGNIRVAPWANRDATPRVIALLGPAHFAIARAEDLPRVLAIAAARAERPKRGQPAAHPAEALLSMEEREGLSLEVEGVGQFVRRGRRGIPDRLRLAALELPQQRIEVKGRFFYPDLAEASDAKAYLGQLRDLYASNTLVSLLGLSDPLEDAQIEQSEREVHVTLTLSADQARLILGYVRELLSPPQLPSRPAPPPSAP